MKILQINKYDYPKGGADKYFLNLSSAFEDAGHEVYRFTMNYPEPLKRKLFWSRRANQELEKILKNFQPEIAHIHNIYHDFSPSILFILKKYKIPTVMTLHDPKIICPNFKLYTEGSPCFRCKGGEFYNAALHRCMKNSYPMSTAAAAEAYLHQTFLKSYEKNIDVYISPSRFLKKTFEVFGMRKKIIHLPNFVRVKKVPRNPKHYLLYLGRWEEEKGAGDILQAMKKMPEETLYVVGGGSYPKKILPNVVYFGFQNNIEKFLAETKLLVVPSRYPDNAPLVIQEAQMLGVPVLASRIGGLPELTNNLFKAGDINDLVQKISSFQDYGTKMPMGEKDHVEKLFKIYLDVLEVS